MPARKRLKIATFNVNGVLTRLPNLLTWLAVAVSAIEDCPVSINLPRMWGERGVTMAAR